jgi:hypothetical protein
MRRLAPTVLLLVLTASPAFAQPAPDTRFIFSFNGGVQVTPNDFSQTGTFLEFFEDGTFRADYELKSPLVVDGALLLRLWKQLHVGAAVSFLDGTTDTNVTATVPHPFFFNQQRNVAGTASLTRRETATHVLLGVPLAIGESGMMLFTVGPTFVNVVQDVVNDIGYESSFPFNEATFRDAITVRVKENGIGYNAGLDLAWFFSRRFGLGMMARYSRASVDLRASDRNTVSSDAGGLHAGGGIRLRF